MDSSSDKKDNKNKNWLIKILIIFIVGLILADFILSEPKYELTEWIVISLALLVILVLSDMFDNLSIPKVLTLSKNIEETKKENSELKETNLRLMEQMINIKNTNSLSVQINGSTNPDDINKNKLEEIENADIENKKEDIQTSKKTIKKLGREHINSRINLKKLLLQKALNMDNFNELNDIKYDVRTVIGSNPNFSEKRIARYDACVSNSGKTIFYDAKLSSVMPSDYLMDDLERKMSVLELCSEINLDCKLIYIIPVLEESLREELYGSRLPVSFKMKDKIVQMYEKDIDNNILEMREIAITKKELDDYIKKQEKENKDK